MLSSQARKCFYGAQEYLVKSSTTKQDSPQKRTEEYDLPLLAASEPVHSSLFSVTRAYSLQTFKVRPHQN